MADSSLIRIDPGSVKSPKKTPVINAGTAGNVATAADKRSSNVQFNTTAEQFSGGLGFLEDVGDVALDQAAGMAKAESQQRAQDEAMAMNEATKFATSEMGAAIAAVPLLNSDKVGEAGATLAQIADKYIKENQGSDSFNAQLESEMAILMDSHIGQLSSNSTTAKRKVVTIQYDSEANTIANQTKGTAIEKARAQATLSGKYAKMIGLPETAAMVRTKQEATLKAEFRRLLRNPIKENITEANRLLDHTFVQSVLDPEDLDKLSAAFLNTANVQAEKQNVKKSAKEVEFDLIDKLDVDDDRKKELKIGVIREDKDTDFDAKVRGIKELGLTSVKEKQALTELYTGKVRAPTEGDKLQSVISTLKLNGVDVDEDVMLTLAGATPKEMSELEKRIKGINELYADDDPKKQKALEAVLTNNADLRTAQEKGHDTGVGKKAELEAQVPNPTRPERVQAAGAGKNDTNITIDLDPGEKKLLETLGDGQGKLLLNASKQAEVAKGTEFQLESMRQIQKSKGFTSGSFADTRIFLGTLATYIQDTTDIDMSEWIDMLGDPQAGNLFEANADRLALDLAKGIGRITNLSLKLALDTVPGLFRTEGGNEIIIALMQRGVDRDKAIGVISEKYQELRTLFPKNEDGSKAESYYEAVRRYDKENPIFDADMMEKMDNIRDTSGKKILTKSKLKSEKEPKPPKGEKGAKYEYSQGEHHYFTRPGAPKGQRAFRIKKLSDELQGLKTK
jgi:hypothetical protein